MGTDVERIASGFRLVHDLWACLIDIGIAIYLLERQVGVACLVPAVIVVGMSCSGYFLQGVLTAYWTSFYISHVQALGRHQQVPATVDRKGGATATFDFLRAREYQSCQDAGPVGEDLFYRPGAAACRNCYLRRVSQASRRDYYSVYVFPLDIRELQLIRVLILRAANSPADLAPMATFAVYVIIALVRQNNSILAAQAFTSLSLISLVTTPVLIFIQAVPAVIQCLGCFDRIQVYCSVPGLHDNQDSHPETSVEKYDGSVGLHDMPKSSADKGELVKFSNQSVGWKRDAPPVLREVQLNIQHNSITTIVGPIGSGKSTLLESILGETLAIGGRADRNFSSVAYCSQSPWLQSQNIRQNIVGASPVDMNWYATVVSACGLEKDLARLPRGDQTPVGSNGLTLSGGQKQRIVSELGVLYNCLLGFLRLMF